MTKRVLRQWRLGWSSVLIVALLASLAAPLGAAAQPEPAALSTASVTGTVTDAGTRAPLEGALVEAERSTESGWVWADSTSTGVDGAYGLYLSAPGQYRVTAWATRYFPSTTEAFHFDGAAPVARNLALRPSPLGVTGRVTDAVSDAPIAGAWVEAERSTESGWEWADFAYVGPEGAYNLHLPGAGDYRLTAWATRYFPSTPVPFHFGGVAPVELSITLTPWPLGVTG
ncbi:MAG TPA: carboxypeptidase-like regulatory domain-containing protein, partial [Desulfobacterales bacterium]|nr:carboxypeptidase-like regulatory domain-containing protein [Desulfobacterales bacterium]